MFCNKCGSELTTDSEFCNKCGAPVERFADEPEMTLEESITFAEKFKARYLSVEKLAREVADNEATIARPVRQTAGQYSFFRFFWKYLIFAAVSFFACDILALIFSFTEGGLYFFFAMMFISPIAVLIIGGIRASKRRDEENEAIYRGNERALTQRKELIEKTASLKKDLAARKRSLEKDEYQIPTSLRKSSSMTQIITLLRSGKASNLTDAYRILGK